VGLEDVCGATDALNNYYLDTGTVSVSVSGGERGAVVLALVLALAFKLSGGPSSTTSADCMVTTVAHWWGAKQHEQQPVKVPVTATATTAR
jgi:hypothetical protein